MSIKQVLTLMVFVLGVFVNLSINASSSEVPFGIRHYDIGSAQNFTLNDIDGEPFELNDSKGRWVFLHFWASWCGPCREEMPVIQELADKMKGEAFQIVMVNTAEDEDTVFEFLGSINVDLNSLMDVDGLVTEVWKPRGLPTSFLINPKGEVKYQAIGGREWMSPVYIGFLKKLLKSDVKLKSKKVSE
ncbi:MAG: alkyl hydroperoxide reductase [endosymbiont of Galathealinum brachiosum]|uniref:Alkyl hydroperoxide reductase n=1 Tax=endosymbiont of Galathealinum brachiosum TaxID=2200906 RepID=A0A370DM25_9GAMM|nr:MAG: alkyl hydroperoxide reductase [endosymbiont of Galathealinum brachiosum]